MTALPKPWKLEFTGAGIRVDASNREPVLFIYGVNPLSRALAEKILEIELDKKA